MSNIIQMQSASADFPVVGSGSRFEIGPTVNLKTSAPVGQPSPGVIRGTRLTALFNCPTLERTNFVALYIMFDAGSRGPYTRTSEHPSGTLSILTFVDDVTPGAHTVTVLGFSRENVVIGPRTLTVWETVVERPQVLVEANARS